MFRPDPNLSPRDFVVALTLFYEDEQGAMLSSTFFNGTVEIVEQKKMIDTEMLFLYLILLGIASGIGARLVASLPAPRTACAREGARRRTPGDVVGKSGRTRHNGWS